MQRSELQPHLLVQDGEKLLQVTGVYGPDRVSARLLYPPPAKPTTNTYTDESVAGWTNPSAELLTAYDPHYSASPSHVPTEPALVLPDGPDNAAG